MKINGIVRIIRIIFLWKSLRCDDVYPNGVILSNSDSLVPENTSQQRPFVMDEQYPSTSNNTDSASIISCSAPQRFNGDTSVFFSIFNYNSMLSILGISMEQFFSGFNYRNYTVGKLNNGNFF